MLKRTLLQTLLAGTALAFTGLGAFAQDAFDGPTSGPKAADGKTIGVRAGDLKNGGIRGVTTGIEEADAESGGRCRGLAGGGRDRSPWLMSPTQSIIGFLEPISSCACPVNFEVDFRG